MLKIYVVGIIISAIFLYIMVEFTACTEVKANDNSPLPPNCVADTATIQYQLSNSFVRVDRNALVFFDTVANKIVQYRLSTGRILPEGTWTWIFDYKNNMPPFPIPE